MNECFVSAWNVRKKYACIGEGWNVCLGHEYKKHLIGSTMAHLSPASWLNSHSWATIMASIHHSSQTYPNIIVSQISVTDTSMSMISCNLQWLPFILTHIWHPRNRNLNLHHRLPL